LFLGPTNFNIFLEKKKKTPPGSPPPPPPAHFTIMLFRPLPTAKTLRPYVRLGAAVGPLSYSKTSHDLKAFPSNLNETVNVPVIRCLPTQCKQLVAEVLASEKLNRFTLLPRKSENLLCPRMQTKKPIFRNIAGPYDFIDRTISVRKQTPRSPKRNLTFSKTAMDKLRLSPYDDQS